MNRYLLAVALVAAAVFLPACKSHAGTAELGYGFQHNGGSQLSGVPIAASAFRFRLDQPGALAWSAELESVETGRGGQTHDRVTGTIGHAWQLGPVTLQPSLIAGYGRGLNEKMGMYGAELRVSAPVWRWLSVEAGARYEHSFAVNVSPLNADELTHKPWSEVRVDLGPVIAVRRNVWVGVQVARISASYPLAGLAATHPFNEGFGFVRLGF